MRSYKWRDKHEISIIYIIEYKFDVIEINI